jgi:hypothetical protein
MSAVEEAHGGQAWCNEMGPEALCEMQYVKPWYPDLVLAGMFSLKSFICPHACEAGLLTDTST